MTGRYVPAKLLETKVLRDKGFDVRRYFRRWSRQAVNLPARIEILLAGGKCFTSGTALIRNISLKGALLAKFVLKKPYLPMRPFTIRMTFRSEKYHGIGAVARPVRLGTGDEFEIAVAFEDLWAAEEE